MRSPQREDLCLKDQVDSNLNLEILAATRKRWTSSLVVIPNPHKIGKSVGADRTRKSDGKSFDERPEKSAKVDLPKRARTEATSQAGSSGGRMSAAPVFAGNVNAIQIEDAIYHHADDEWDPAEDFEQGDEGFDEIAGSLEFAEDEFAEDNDADVASESVLPGCKEAELWFDPGPGGSEPVLDCEVWTKVQCPRTRRSPSHFQQKPAQRPETAAFFQYGPPSYAGSPYKKHVRGKLRND